MGEWKWDDNGWSDLLPYLNIETTRAIFKELEQISDVNDLFIKLHNIGDIILEMCFNILTSNDFMSPV